MEFKVERLTVQAFEPIVVMMTLSSKEEAQEFYGILNHGAIVSTASELGLCEVRTELLKVYPEVKNNFQDFADKLRKWFAE